MSLAIEAVEELSRAHARFLRSTASLPESLSGFAPAEGMMTAAQQVAHVARVVDWFLEGAFRADGFDLDFEPQIQLVTAVTSLSAARGWLDQSFAAAISALASQTDEALLAPIPPGPVLGGQPRLHIVREITDHTAHHRGALTAYARANGISPPDPYAM
jgi:uncharacterized damage-inducible protein DinB